jgi:hypothetical protein
MVVAFFEILGILTLLSFSIQATAFLFDFLTKPVPRRYPAPVRPRTAHPRARMVSFKTHPD